MAQKRYSILDVDITRIYDDGQKLGVDGVQNPMKNTDGTAGDLLTLRVHVRRNYFFKDKKQGFHLHFWP